MRSLRRAVAKVRMRKAGWTRICKKQRGDRHGSKFAAHWREFI